MALVSTDNYIFQCPNCNHDVIVDKRDINCCIFRHGIFKNNFQQIPPHSSENMCKKYIENDQIYGCGLPFQINFISETNYEVIKCDYI